jgi:hypothetical protein
MKYVLMLVFLIGWVFSVPAATEYREFTSTDGKTIRGAIQAFDARTQTVTIEREGKGTSKVPLSIFSEKDQAYVLEWEAAKDFLSSSLLKIQIDDKVVEKRVEKEVEDITYYRWFDRKIF